MVRFEKKEDFDRVLFRIFCSSIQSIFCILTTYLDGHPCHELMQGGGGKKNYNYNNVYCNPGIDDGGVPCGVIAAGTVVANVRADGV